MMPEWMGKSGDLNKGRTCENDPADIARHHNPAQELPELTLRNQHLLSRYPAVKAELLTRDSAENAQIQSSFLADTQRQSETVPGPLHSMRPQAPTP